MNHPFQNGATPWKHWAAWACMAWLAGCAAPSSPSSSPAAASAPSPIAKVAGSVDISRQALAAKDGWAAAEGGTRGGADAAPEHVFDVRNRNELVAALERAGQQPKIVRIHGTIDLSVDDANRPLGEADYRDPAFDFAAFVKAYDPATWGKKPPEGPLEEARKRSSSNQAKRVVVRVPSNTSLIGVGAHAHIIHGMLLLDKVDNVIVRNIHFADAYDYFPEWDPKDNAHGEWNSEYDTVSLRGATHVWVDHCTFSDGNRPDPTAQVALGRRMQHHDGLLDITQQSNYVTVSYNHFKDHDKTNLVGSSDSQKLDEGKLKVSFHHNLWENTKERSPRVRYGQVHLYNNLYVADTSAVYPHGYSIGVGFNSRIYAQNNVWETQGGVLDTRLTRLWKGSTFFDQGSLHNGRAVDLLAGLRAANPGASVAGDVGWLPVLHGPLEPASEVSRSVRAQAGAGRL